MQLEHRRAASIVLLFLLFKNSNMRNLPKRIIRYMTYECGTTPHSMLYITQYRHLQEV